MKKARSFFLACLAFVCLVGFASPSGATSASQIGVLKSVYLQLAEEENWKYFPVIAYAPDHNVFLVVWENWWPGGNIHDLFGRRVSGNGQVLEDFVIYSGTYNSLQPAVAYDSTNSRFLVAWSYDYYGNGSDYDIRARYIPWSGVNPAWTDFVIDQSTTSSGKPRLAYSPTDDVFMFAWKDETSPSSIAGALLDNDRGAVARIAISSGPEVRDFPAITYNQSENDFVVAWDVDMGRDVTDLDIYAVRLSTSGAPLGLGEFPVSTLAQNEQHPTLAACWYSNQVMFAWQQQVNTTSTDDNIFGRMMYSNGLLSQSYGIAGTTLPQQYPSISCNTAGNTFMLAWQDQYAQPLLRWGIWAEIIKLDFTVLPAFEVVRPSDTRDRLYPGLAFGDGKALIAWQHAREDSSYLDIWAQMEWTDFNSVYLPFARR
jgi:hypothetical protein